MNNYFKVISSDFLNFLKSKNIIIVLLLIVLFPLLFSYGLTADSDAITIDADVSLDLLDNLMFSTVISGINGSFFISLIISIIISNFVISRKIKSSIYYVEASRIGSLKTYYISKIFSILILTLIVSVLSIFIENIFYIIFFEKEFEFNSTFITLELLFTTLTLFISALIFWLLSFKFNTMISSFVLVIIYSILSFTKNIEVIGKLNFPAYFSDNILEVKDNEITLNSMNEYILFGLIIVVTFIIILTYVYKYKNTSHNYKI